MTEEERGLGAWPWILPLVVLAAGTVSAWIFDLDLLVSRLLHVPGAAQPWPLGNTDLARFLEGWVWLPGAALAVAAGVLIARGMRRRRRPLVRAGLILVTSLAVGPVLLANEVLKPNYGRPRPQDVVEFGGGERYLPALQPGPGGGDSFPSGHAAAAFSLTLPFLAFRRIARRLARATLALGLAYGCLIGFIRIAHGRHFLTDVLWAGGLVWYTGCAATALFEWLLPSRSRDSREPESARPAVSA